LTAIHINLLSTLIIAMTVLFGRQAQVSQRSLLKRFSIRAPAVGGCLIAVVLAAGDGVRDGGPDPRRHPRGPRTGVPHQAPQALGIRTGVHARRGGGGAVVDTVKKLVPAVALRNRLTGDDVENASPFAERSAPSLEG
jgi:hypothetical protein